MKVNGRTRTGCRPGESTASSFCPGTRQQVTCSTAAYIRCSCSRRGIRSGVGFTTGPYASSSTMVSGVSGRSPYWPVPIETTAGWSFQKCKFFGRKRGMPVIPGIGFREFLLPLRNRAIGRDHDVVTVPGASDLYPAKFRLHAIATGGNERTGG